jgi:UDP-glucuronate decarboxylase
MDRYLKSDIEEIWERLGSRLDPMGGSTVLITGAHGFLGRYFTALFHSHNAAHPRRAIRLILLDNHITSDAEPGSEEHSGKVRFIPHDVIQPIEIHEPVDYVIHAAGIASPFYYRKYPLETLEVATIGTKNLLQLAKNHPLKGFLFFSSSEIYGDPDPKHVPTQESYRGNISSLGPRACYDESKRLGETLCQIFHEKYGVPTKMVRPFNVYGPGMKEADYRVLPNFASRIKSGKPIHVYGHGKQTRTFCYIVDAIVGFTLVLLDGMWGQVYNIGNREPEVSVWDLVKILEKVLRKKILLEQVEYPDSYPADEPQRRCPDITKAAFQLGYEPQVPLEEGLSRFMGWALERYKGL